MKVASTDRCRLHVATSHSFLFIFIIWILVHVLSSVPIPSDP